MTTAGRPLFGAWALATIVLAISVLSSVPVYAAELDVVLGRGEAIGLERHEVEIRVDGLLDEAVWQDVPAYGDFYVTNPDTLKQPTYETRVRIFYSSKGIHIGVDADQPTDTLLPRLSGRDTWVQGRDWINVSLDTSGTGRYGFFFELALGGSISDGTILPERQFSFDWDGPWRGATKETGTGWSAEFMIPWGTVSMPKVEDIRRMGVYVSRSVAYRNEFYAWPGLAMTRPVFLSGMQPVELSGVNPRQQYNFYPYASVTRDEVEGDTEFKAGADLFWRPSSNFQLNATLNPDFGAVESDDVVINLTATETFFPEKRLFFLEGQQIFSATPRADTRSFGIGNRGSPYTLVNTRRVGGKPEDPDIPDDWDVEDRDLVQPVELLGALKTTGQIGEFRYGLLGAFEDDVKFRATDVDDIEHVVKQGGNNYGAARLLWENNDGGSYRALGFLTTAIQKDVEGDAYATGIDWHYYTRNSKMQIDGQALTSDIEDIGRGYGGFVDAVYAHRQGVSTTVGLEYFDDKIDLNDLGFLERNDHWQIRASHQRTTSDISFGQQNRFDIRGGVRHNLDGYLIRTAVLMSDSLTLNSLHRLFVNLSYQPEQYDDLNSFGNGTYGISDAIRASAGFTSNPTRPLSVSVAVGTSGEDTGGQSWTMGAGIDWRPSDRFNFGLKLNYLDRDGWLLHQQGRNMTTFQADQIAPIIDGEYFISAKQQFRVSLQWVAIKAREDQFWLIPDEPGDLIEVEKPPGPTDDFSISQLSFQARYRWQIAPLSDLFVVYTRLASQGDQLIDEDFGELFESAWDEPIGNLFIVKLRYRFGS